jgi:hypothetical protein
MPPLLQLFPVAPDNFIQLMDFMTPEAARIFQHDRLQPEFRVSIPLLDMHMRRFRPFIAEEEKSVPSFPEYSRHPASHYRPERKTGK